MKIRIQGNSLRLRLMKSEVGMLSTIGYLKNTISFGSRSLDYSLKLDSSTDQISATFVGDEIRINIPEQMGKIWSEGDSIGMEVGKPGHEHDTLHILIEKDFTCLKEREGEDESDAYPNPLLEKI